MKLTTCACSLSLALVAGVLSFPAVSASASAPAPRPSLSAANGITVTVVGTHLASYSHLVVAADLLAFGPTGTEAVQAFEQKLARTLTGLNDSSIEGLEVKAGGAKSSFGVEASAGGAGGMEAMFMMDQAPSEDDMGLNLSQSLEIRFAASGDAAAQRVALAEIVDTTQDLDLALAGGSSAGPAYYGVPQLMGGSGSDGPTGMLSGSLEGEAEATAQEEAQKAAMDNARRQAGKLASLGGRSIGDVVSITQKSLGSEWKGLGEGVEVKCVLEVTFSVQ